MRRLLPLLVLLTLAALSAPGTALAQATDPPPEPVITVGPGPVKVGVAVPLQVENATAASYNWEVPNGALEGNPGTSVQWTPGAEGTDLEIRANDGAGNVLTRNVTVEPADPPPPPPPPDAVNAAPVINGDAFVSNDQPEVGQPINVSVEAEDPDGGELTYHWSATGGDAGFDPQTHISGMTVTFTRAGRWRVKVKVTDRGIAGDPTPKSMTAESRVIIVSVNPPRNQPPTGVSFTYAPSAPQAGQAVVFTGTGSDPDGNIQRYDWDFDSDGVVDASANVVARAFPSAGEHTVTVKAIDNRGDVSIGFQTIFVSSPPAGEVLGTSNSGSPPTASTPSSGQGQPRPTTARLLSPFPMVRLRGSVVGLTARISLLSVQGAPRGAKVRVRCRGGGCPRKLVTSTARSSRSTMRLRSFERRLRVGAKLEIYITQSGRLGKYTLFEIRRGAAPRRVDRCVRSFPGKPVTCPDTA